MQQNITYLMSFLLLIAAVTVSPVRAQFRTDRPTFFREGYDQMQQEIQRIQRQQQEEAPQQLLEHPSQLLTINNGELRWQKYIFREGGFSIWMPEAIQSNEVVVLDTDLGKISFEVFASHPQNLRYVTAYSYILDAPVLSNPEALLLAVKRGVIARTQYQLKDDREIRWEKHPGRQLSMENQGEMITFRIYVIDKRIYVLAASQKETNEIAKNVQEFFDSFRILN